MNTENRFHVSPSFFALREIKSRQDQVDRGYQLLKKKAEALQSKHRQATAELNVLQSALGEVLKEAYMTLAAIKFANGESNALVLENVGEAQLRVQCIPENIAGVQTVTLQAVEHPTSNDTLQYVGLGAGGSRAVEAKKSFRSALNIIVKLASLRNTCIILDEAIKSTLRKIKGIEKVILPKLRNTENYIVTEIDEREREEFHRLKMVKAKKIQIKSMASTSAVIKEGDENEDIDAPKIRPRIWTMSNHSQPYTLVPCGDSSAGDQPSCVPTDWDDDEIIF